MCQDRSLFFSYIQGLLYTHDSTESGGSKDEEEIVEQIKLDVAVGDHAVGSELGGSANVVRPIRRLRNQYFRSWQHFRDKQGAEPSSRLWQWTSY